MNYRRNYFVCIFSPLVVLLVFFVTFATFAQKETARGKIIVLSDTASIFLKDTVFNIAFDSLKNNLGNIDPINTSLVKYFKYVGSDSLYITTSWTTDPHIICEYPRGQLIPGKIYSYKVCFWHQGRQGKFYKTLGFDLSDGNRVMLIFYGNIVPMDIK